MLDLHRLRLLRELEIRGTVTAVAESLRYSPSAVSQQLAKLEEEAGAVLLEREGRRLRLTAQGLAVAAHAAEVMEREERLRSGLEAAAQEIVGVVRLAVLDTVMHALLPSTLDRFASAYPRVRLEAAVVPPEWGLNELRSHGFDLVIAEQYPGETRELRPGVDHQPLGEDPIRLAVPADSGITALADAGSAHWIVEPAGSAARHWTVQQCRAAGFEPDIRFEATDLQGHVRLVAAGHAAALLPDLACAHEDASIRLIELPDAPRRELFTAARRSAHARPAVVAVRAALQESWDARM